MSSSFTLPSKKSVIYWPVGCGDSTTLVIRPNEIVAQIDLHHLAKAANTEEPEWPIVDHLVRVLPKRNGRPYLALFVLTHPDKDHILGFADLLSKVHIGELWHTPKVFRDLEKNETLCDDAKAFRTEAQRRRAATIAHPDAVKSGDRLRVIGHDDILKEDKYKGLPDSCKSRPSDKVSSVDGLDLRSHFQAFIHAPFKADQAESRNNTSLSLNVVLWEGNKHGQFFFFGDREYPTIKQIFETTEAHGNEAYLFWDVMLASHHCSKAVMHWQDEGDEDVAFKKDIMDFFATYSRDKNGFIISSSHSDFTDGEGHNPPHLRARKRYEEIVKAGRFLCTHEFPSKASPWPIVFTMDEEGVKLIDKREAPRGLSALAASVALARGVVAPPSVQMGFGKPE